MNPTKISYPHCSERHGILCRSQAELLLFRRAVLNGGDFVFRFLEIFGKRDIWREYEGNGNFSEERGWWFLGHWISAEKYL